jgi:hypothetical protein
MKLLYKPFSLIAGLIAARIGKAIFKVMWSRVDTSEPPEATAPQTTAAKVVGAAALEAATMAGVGAAVERVAAQTFHYLTGIWPGKEPEKTDRER